ncbi:MAG: type II toxin-antitoxin system RelE/ParE family toxin [Prevotella sp.]|nr:type II toxin-antitoxin system RelE/ParE family toxin [Prevotella sp.]
MRRIIAYKKYFGEFMKELSDQERGKIKRALLLLESEDKIPSHYIKYVRDGLYEFRVSFGNKEFRLFYIYDGNNIVVLFNCYTKKTEKAPKREIDKAIKLKEEYQNERKRNDL